MSDPAVPSPGPAVCRDCGGMLPAGDKTFCPKCLWQISFNPVPEDALPGEGETAWARLGDYDLYDEIAHGGMGVVYRAKQRRLGRTVAVKVLRGGALAEPEARLRFRREAESAGRLQHPGVVAVHDVGEDQGVCWFSMDYVPGEDLAQRVQQRPLEAKAAADCVRQVAEAIHHAHLHGVLHRDLKPSNILMGLDDQPKVTDFGIARHLGDTAAGGRIAALTHSGQTLGSPSYASPEQALRGAATVRSDVYGLGAVLYHTLTGRAPFVGPTLDSILLQLREADPVRPRRLNPTVPRDLETICLKCLEKQPEQRYATAAAVAEDLRRFGAGESLLAKPVSGIGRSVRWCRRRPALAGLGLALLAAAGTGTAGVFHQWRRAEINLVEQSEQRMLAQAGERAARLRTYTAGVYAASQALLAEDTGLAGNLLARLVPAAGAEDFRGPEWYLLNDRTRSQDLEVMEGHPWIVACLAASPDGKWLASGGRFVSGWGGEQSTAFIWEPATGRRVYDLPVGIGSVKSLQFTPEGDYLMLAAAGRVRFLRTGTWQQERNTVPGRFGCLAHGKPWLAVIEAQSGGVALYDRHSLTLLKRLPVSGAMVEFSKNDEFLLVTGAQADLQLCPVDGSGPGRRFATGRRMNAASLSPDGRWLAACGGPDVMVWDLMQPEEARPRLLSGHHLDVKSLVFSTTGDQLITTGSDRTIRFWNTADWKPAGLMRGHRDEVWCALPDPAGRWLCTGSKDRTVRLWPVRPPQEPHWPSHFVVLPAVWSQDGRQIILAGGGGTSTVCDAETLTTGKLLPTPTGQAAGPDGTWVRFAEAPGRLEWFDSGGEIRKQVELEGDPVRFNEVDSKSWSRDGRRFGLILPDLKVGVWDTATGRRLALLDRPAGGITMPITLNADGSQLAVAGSTAAVIKLFSVDSGASRSLIGHLAQITSLAFSPDGRQLASGSMDATVRLWETSTGEVQAVLRGHVQDVTCLAYAPGGRSLASMGNFEAVRLWNLETATEVATLPQPHAANWLAFSPNGRWLAVAQGDPAERASPELEQVMILPTGQDDPRD